METWITPAMLAIGITVIFYMLRLTHKRIDDMRTQMTRDNDNLRSQMTRDNENLRLQMTRDNDNLRSQMTREHDTLAGKVDSLTDVVTKHVTDYTVHTSSDED